MKFTVEYEDGTESVIDFYPTKAETDIAYTVIYDDGLIQKKEIKKGKAITVPENATILEITEKKWVE